MNEWKSTYTATPLIDAHVHMGSITTEGHILGVLEATDIDKMGLVSIQNPAAGSGLPQSLAMKARHPDTFYVFAGLNHATALSHGRVAAPSLADQVDAFIAAGCDGIKMIEGKPTSRQIMDIPVTAPYFAEYWARVAEVGLPIVWHVNDPEEFWDPDALPAWARERGWGYGPGDVRKEQLYAEVDEVLALHPELPIIFAHFYFLSADLHRAASFLDAHPTVCFDLTPGVEMLHNLSRNVEASRDFFIRYADRIVYGTDIASGNTLIEAQMRAGLVFRWLESQDTFRVPETADFLLGKPEDGEIRGLALPDQVLRKIYHDNITRLAGTSPRQVDVPRAIELSRQIASIAEAMSEIPAAETEGGRVAQLLSTESLTA
jgi:predicted TIM-barrel fold metal-dependent hydrolase